MPRLAPLLLALLLAACGAPAQLSRYDAGLVAGRTFVITGASSGFGRGTALKLAAYGGNVVLAARRGDALEAAAAQARAAGGQALAVPTDVSDPDAVGRLADAALARFGRIDVWINNAAVGGIGRFDDIPLRDHARIVDVNLKGTIYGSHAALRAFRRQGFGTLVNIASVEGRVPLAYHASYAATKHAVIGLSNAIRQELRLAGAGRIQVATVLPWAADTPFWQNTANYSGGTPRIYTMDGPNGVVDAIIWTAIHPSKEVTVGWKATGAVLGERVWPGLAERMAADLVQYSQITNAPPAPPTDGALFQPLPSGPTTTGVEGGARTRMEKEDAARRAGATPPAR